MKKDVLVPVEVLRVATNTEIESPYSTTGSWNVEITKCSECGREADGWHSDIEHKVDCSYVSKQVAIARIKDILEYGEDSDINVEYQCKEGRHIFTSNDMPGLLVVSKLLQEAVNDIYPSIRKLKMLNAN